MRAAPRSTYNFRYGMPVDFVDSEGMLTLFLELAPVLREIVDANEIAERLSIKDHGALLAA